MKLVEEKKPRGEFAGNCLSPERCVPFFLSFLLARSLARPLDSSLRGLLRFYQKLRECISYTYLYSGVNLPLGHLFLAKSTSRFFFATD